jgi:hypothetical protein
MLITESSLRRLIRKILSEAKDQNSDGKNDFRDVKIARMKASGMSKKDIEKKHPNLYEDEEDVDYSHGKLLSEPDLSAEDERHADDEVDEMSTLGGGAIRGYQAPLGYNSKKMKGY